MPEDPAEWPPEIDGLVATMIRQREEKPSGPVDAGD